MAQVWIELRPWVLPYLVLFGLGYLVAQSYERLLTDRMSRLEAQLETNTAVVGNMRDLLSMGGFIVPPALPFQDDAE